jgi:arginase family enzyme
MATKADYIFISFDTDSINSKYMPGVSAPSVVGGLTSA